MDILDLKIDIREKDAKNYADVAFLVDKEKVLKDIYYLRKKWKIKRLVDSGNKIVHFKNIAKIRNEKAKKIVQPKYKDWLDELQKKDMVLYREFEKDIRYLLSEYGRHRGYYRVLESALLTGTISNNTYRHTYWVKGVKSEEKDEFMSYGQPAIYVSAQSTEDDVKKEFRKVRRYFRKEPESIYEKYIDRFYKKSKSFGEIKFDRDVYWRYLKEKKEGRGVLPRLRRYIEQKYDTDIEEANINKIIMRYKKALQL